MVAGLSVLAVYAATFTIVSRLGRSAGPWSAELAARIQKACFDDLDAPVERVGMAEVPLPYAKELEHAAMPNEDRIAAAVRATAGRPA